MRTNDQALRCWIEEGQEYDAYEDISEEERVAYMRLPIVSEPGLPSGAFYIRTYGNNAVEITEKQARKHPMFAFQAL